MKRVLLFGGTTEGRELCERWASLPFLHVTVCVATSYGRELLSGVPENIEVLEGRKGAHEIAGLLSGEPDGDGADVVVDATHPFALEVSRTLRTVCGETGVPYLRLLRPRDGFPGAERCILVDSAAQACEALAKTTGPVLLTTGAKELDAFSSLPHFAERVYARVLPSAESVEKCAALGLPRPHILALQGPFSRKLNRALLEEYGIRWLVTKETGEAGGFPEKLLAAFDCGATPVVLRRPPEEGLTAQEICRMVEEETRCD